MSRYHDVYAAWQRDPQGFWAAAASAIDWFRPWDAVLSRRDGLDRWFAGAECNTAWNCLDRHVAAGHGERVALIYDSAVTGVKRTYNYRALLEEVETFAAVLADLGVVKGDRVLIYMPMVPEVVVAMLAVARLGAIHSVVFGGFAPAELAVRISDAKPKVIVSASCGIEVQRVIAYKPLLDQALSEVQVPPRAVVVLQRPELAAELLPGRDHDYASLVAAARDRGLRQACVPVAATDPLYILYTSGTTGQPKGIVRDNGGHLVALAWSMPNVYDIAPGETFWAASDIGWAVGHSYIVYAPLIIGAASVLYEGKPVGTPDAGAFWRVIAEHGVVALFTAPTAFRAIKRDDPAGAEIARYPMPRFRTLFLAGERADTDTIKWAESMLKVPVIDHWWQTESGWPMAANPVGLGMLPVKYGSVAVPMPGYDIAILDGEGRSMAPGKLGAIAVKLPLPPGCLPTLWNAEERFRQSYLSRFQGFYETADAGYCDEDGYLFVMARTDDIINVAGHRLSTGAMEEVLASHPDVAECAVLGIKDAIKGQVPLGLVVMKAGVARDTAAIEAECVQRVRDAIGAVAALRTVIAIRRLPKTRSGKILRGTMRRIADGEPWKLPATIDDPAILDEISEALAGRGIMQR
ncbi:MAG TPA: AMP-binding protein [Aestuariivirgaceae bacterium]|jgi:propionyl-CoA synthetase|nr:AMP-binding protein [Aestuariivirgaceae bacterium]